MANICWVDLTDLAGWSGHMTGIQRVIYNIAKQYNSGGETKFFVYNPSEGFSEVDFELVATKSNDTVSDHEISVTPTKMKRLISGLYNYNKPYIKRGAKYIYNRVPGNVQTVLMNRYRPGVDSEVVDLSQPINNPFGERDTILILGASWHKSSIIRSIGHLKNQKRLKVVHVVYDMIPEIEPQYFGQGFGDVYIKHMFDVMSISDHLLAISENTKKDILSFQSKMLLAPVPVTVFRLGDNPTYTSANESPDSRVHKGEYILAVGTLEVRKNYLFLYNTWKKASKEGRALPKLVIVGQNGWLAGDAMYLIHFDPEIRDSIVVLSNVDDSSLSWLYENCLFTIYPSLYEGWGLPIAESLNYGKTCLASNTSSMTEIAGDKINYFDPFDIKELLSGIRYLLDKDNLSKAEAKVATYRKVSWEKGYRQCVKVTNSFFTES